MTAYLASGPRGERLRFVHFPVLGYPIPGKQKVVVQAMDRKWPIAEDPLAVDYLNAEEIEQYISESRRQGWTFDAA